MYLQYTDMVLREWEKDRCMQDFAEHIINFSKEYKYSKQRWERGRHENGRTVLSLDYWMFK